MKSVREVLLCAATAAVGSLALTANSRADVVWQVQASFSNSSGPDSLKGIGLSPDGTEEYLGFIQSAGGGTTAVDEYSTGIIAGTANAGSSSSLNGAAASEPLSGYQPKGVAVDDRGNVYATVSNSSGAATESLETFNSNLAVEGTAPTPSLSGVTLGGNYQLSGIAVQDVDGTYYAYVATGKGPATIERFNVTDPAHPTLDTSWANGGILDMKALLKTNNGFVNGLEVAPNGTIYATGGILSTDRGDSVFEISADGSTVLYQNNNVTEAVDLALYGGNVYVAEYNGGSSQVAVLSESDLSSEGTLPTGSIDLGSTAAGTDDGFAGIAVNAAGQLFVTDEAYGSGLDQVLVSSPVPEPATLGLIGISSVLLLRRRRRAV